MTELIKQRLVGILIMVIAGVVFIPDLLDGKKQLTKEEFKNIPPKPELQTPAAITEFPEEQVLQALSKAPESANDVAIDDSQEQARHDKSLNKVEQFEAPEVTTPDNREVKKTAVVTLAKPEVKFQKQLWVLRLGSFRNKPNVDALIKKLEGAGVQTFVKPVHAKVGLLYRVFVGPKETKSELASAQKTLKELTGLTGKITQFDPIN